MDQTPNSSINSEYREKIYKELAEVMLHDLEAGQISIEESKKLSQFILDHLDSVKTYTELSSFLQELVNKWPVYKTVSMQLQDDLEDKNLKEEKIEEIREDISHINNQ